MSVSLRSNEDKHTNRKTIEHFKLNELKNIETTKQKHISFEQILPREKRFAREAIRKTSFLPFGKLYCNWFSNFNFVISRHFQTHNYEHF